MQTPDASEPHVDRPDDAGQPALDTLLRRSAEGDRAAFSAFYDATVPWVHGLAEAMFGPGDDAAAATVRTYLTAWEEASEAGLDLSERDDATHRERQVFTWLEVLAHRVMTSLRRAGGSAAERGRRPGPAGSGLLFEGIVAPTASEGPAFVQTGFDAMFTGFGPTFVAVALAFFAFTTIVAYYYMAEVNLVFLTRNLRNGMVRRVVLRFLQALILVSVAYGAVATTGAAWGLGDIGVGSMAWLNILGILVLQGPALKALKDYRAQKRQGLDPQFDPRPLGIRNADFWEHRADGLITQGVAGTAEHPIVTEGGAHRA